MAAASVDLGIFGIESWLGPLVRWDIVMFTVLRTLDLDYRNLPNIQILDTSNLWCLN